MVFRLVQRSKDIDRVLFQESLFRRIGIEAAGPVKDERGGSVDILEPCLEISHLSADQSSQTDIGVVIPCILPVEVEFPECLDIPFLVAGLVPVFAMQEQVIPFYLALGKDLAPDCMVVLSNCSLVVSKVPWSNSKEAPALKNCWGFLLSGNV